VIAGGHLSCVPRRFDIRRSQDFRFRSAHGPHPSGSGAGGGEAEDAPARHFLLTRVPVDVRAPSFHRRHRSPRKRFEA